jgi:hypothetical protein
MEGEQASERAPNDARTSLQSQDRFLTALTSEYTTLQSARSTTVFESNGRVAVYLSTVSSFVVALSFIGTVSRVGQPFYLFALVLLPAVFVLGTVTYMRTIQSGTEDLLLSRAMARIVVSSVNFSQAPRTSSCSQPMTTRRDICSTWVSTLAADSCSIRRRAPSSL